MRKAIISRFKATISTRTKNYKRASITIEAAFSLSIFIFCIVILLAPMVAIKQHLHTSKLLEEKARLLSKLKYAEYYVENSEKINIADGTLDGMEAAVSIANFYMDIDTSGLLYADFITESHVSDEGIQFVLNYSINIPFPFMNTYDFHKQVLAYRRPWIGAEPYRFEGEGEENDEGEEETIVYVGISSTDKYHSRSTCSYLRSVYKSAKASKMSSVKNKFGNSYHACNSCHPSETVGTVYYTTGGSAYHSSKSCPSMQAYPYTMTLSQALSEGRTLCHRCPEIS